MTVPVEKQALAGEIARRLQERNRFIDMPTMRAIVDEALEASLPAEREEMVERVAKALYHEAGYTGWPKLGSAFKEAYRRQARVALEASNLTCRKLPCSRAHRRSYTRARMTERQSILSDRVTLTPRSVRAVIGEARAETEAKTWPVAEAATALRSPVEVAGEPVAWRFREKGLMTEATYTRFTDEADPTGERRVSDVEPLYSEATVSSLTSRLKEVERERDNLALRVGQLNERLVYMVSDFAKKGYPS